MNYSGNGVEGARAKLVSLGVDGFVVVCFGGRKRRVELWKETKMNKENIRRHEEGKEEDTRSAKTLARREYPA